MKKCTYYNQGAFQIMRLKHPIYNDIIYWQLVNRFVNPNRHCRFLRLRGLTNLFEMINFVECLVRIWCERQTAVEKSPFFRYFLGLLSFDSGRRHNFFEREIQRKHCISLTFLVCKTFVFSV